MPHKLAEIAQQFSLPLTGDGDLEIRGLCGISDNLDHHLSFISSEKLVHAAASSRIPAFVAKPDCRIAGKAMLHHGEPEYVMARIATLFLRSTLSQRERIHASAAIDETAAVDLSASVGAHCVIGADVTIGAGSVIQAGTIVMDRVTIGADCIINPNCVIREDCVLGDRVMLQPGVVVGGDGFGFVRHDQEHVKIPQLGNVVIESDVEIGANSTIDRGRFSSTRIGRGTKIDNAVMIAHNVQVGERCLLVAQSGISGSSRLGNEVVLAGQVGLVGHIEISDNVTLLGQSMATKDIREPGVWAGSPARPAKIWKRAFARLYAGLRTN